MTLDLLKQKMAGVETLLPQFEQNGVDLEKLKKEFNQTQIATLNLEEVVKGNQLREQNNTQRIINLIETLAQNLDKLENKFNSFKTCKSKVVLPTPGFPTRRGVRGMSSSSNTSQQAKI